MPENTYEITYIVNSVLSEDQIRNLVNRVTKFIEKEGGEIIEVDEWGAQRLAYPIGKKRTGHYVNAYFKAGGDLIARLERALTLEDDILRYLTLKMDAPMLRHYAKRKEEKAREEAEAANESAADQQAEQVSADAPAEASPTAAEVQAEAPAEASPAPEEAQAEPPAEASPAPEEAQVEPSAESPPASEAEAQAEPSAKAPPAPEEAQAEPPAAKA